MATKSDLLDSELMKILCYTRLDATWKMLGLMKQGQHPGIADEGCTGKLDNKGGIFLPGGMIYRDVDKQIPQKIDFESRTKDEFRESILGALNNDGATLLHPDGISIGVSIDNGTFADLSCKLFANRRAAHSQRKKLPDTPPKSLVSNDIAKSYFLPQNNLRTGERTKISSCIAACMTEMEAFFIESEAHYGFHDNRDEVYEQLKSAQEVVKGVTGLPFANPHVVVYHTTRYRERNIAGLTRIMGYGKFGEFSTFTLERVTDQLVKDLEEKTTSIKEDHYFAQTEEVDVVGILRMYGNVKPGQRPKTKPLLHLVTPEEMGINPKAVEEEARERYKIAA